MNLNNNVYVVFDYVDQDVYFKGNLKEIKDFIIELGTDNQWKEDIMERVKELTTEKEFKLFLYKEMDCYLQ